MKKIKTDYYAVEREELCQIKKSLLSYKKRLEDILEDGGDSYKMTRTVKELEECENSIKFTK